MKIPKTSFEIPIICPQENIINNREINHSSRTYGKTETEIDLTSYQRVITTDHNRGR